MMTKKSDNYWLGKVCAKNYDFSKLAKMFPVKAIFLQELMIGGLRKVFTYLILQNPSVFFYSDSW